MRFPAQEVFKDGFHYKYKGSHEKGQRHGKGAFVFDDSKRPESQGHVTESARAHIYYSVSRDSSFQLSFITLAVPILVLPLLETT